MLKDQGLSFGIVIRVTGLRMRLGDVNILMR